jgi:hypothetical protein
MIFFIPLRLMMPTCMYLRESLPFFGLSSYEIQLEVVVEVAFSAMLFRTMHRLVEGFTQAGSDRIFNAPMVKGWFHWQLMKGVFPVSSDFFTDC